MNPHLQSTSYTTAAASLLNILHYLNPEIHLTKEKEFHIWHSTTNLPTRASSIYALALYAQQHHNITPKIIVEKKQYDFPDYRFYRYTKEDIEHAAFSSNNHMKKAEKTIQIEEKTINFNDIKELLNNNILLLRLNTKPIRNEKRNTSNYIAILEYSNNQFKIIDPKIGKLDISHEILKESFESLETKK